MPVAYMMLVVFGLGLLLAFRLRMSAIGRRQQKDWHSILAELRPLPNRELHSVAELYLHPKKNQIEVEPAEIFQMLGGLSGLDTIEHNAKVIRDLANYAICWNLVEATIVAEMIRRDADRLHVAMRSLRWQLHFHGMGMRFRQMGVQVPFQLQEIAAAYHLMTARLLALYETSHVGLHPALLRAL